MRLLLLITILMTNLFGFIDNLESFKADFVQNITNDKNKVLTYSGKLYSSKPQSALWIYNTPVKKSIYINRYNIVIVEPEIEQAIVRKVTTDFDFFKIIKNAKKIDDTDFVAKFENTTFKIKTKNSIIESISYIDQFENKVKILFSNQIQNGDIDKKIFTPIIPLEFDIIRD